MLFAGNGEVGNNMDDTVRVSKKTPTHVSFKDPLSNNADETAHANDALPHIYGAAASSIKDEPLESTSSAHFDVSHIGVV